MKSIQTLDDLDPVQTSMLRRATLRAIVVCLLLGAAIVLIYWGIFR